MKKVILLSSALFLAACANSFATTSEYVVDDMAVEMSLNSGIEVATLTPITNAETTTSALAATTNALPTAMVAGKDGTTAFLLSFFLGALGIHRFYMGTATLTGIGYILTLGGCGIVATVDWIVLLIAMINKEGIDKYEDNPKFFMWSGN